MTAIYHFLGGIKFAIFLIASVTLFVIVGTFIESKTESHSIAANWIYNSSLFSFFIWGFFINILFSATRRWPFKKKHIPFLITHFGLLMILSGVMIKNYFGTQGVMSLMEGTGSDTIVLSRTNHEKAAYWNSILLPALIKKQESGHDLIKYLEMNNWPLMNELKSIQDQPLPVLLKTLLKQIDDLAEYLPDLKQSIPYRLRLRNARQINYPNSSSSYSFEADLIITDKKNKIPLESTISMNEVHETWDGYRFYLSHISPGNETDVQTVQIVVNHDPAKYYFTYPGALILSIGIFLLFWFKK